MIDAVSAELPLIGGLKVDACQIFVNLILSLVVPPLKMSIRPFSLVFEIFVDLRRCQFGFGIEPCMEFMKEFFCINPSMVCDRPFLSLFDSEDNNNVGFD